MQYHLLPLGDNGIIIEFGTKIDPDIQETVQRISTYLDEQQPEWLIEYIPAYTTVTVFYNPAAISNLYGDEFLPYDFVTGLIKQLLASLPSGRRVEHRVVKIPVCYGGEFGPDLEAVAELNGLTTDEVIHIHSTGDYLVYMIGFAPGFPFIGGMQEKIAAPRRETPRLKIPAGSVGIAGKQTGIYPIETPGGWQLIGRSPIRLFKPEAEHPSLLKAGDKVEFFPISMEEYRELEGDEN